MKTFHVQLITPDKTLFEGEIIRLNVNFLDGQIEILGGHMSSLGEIAAGKCEITLPDDTRKVFASNDGILNISSNKVVLTSDLLEWEENLENAVKARESHISIEQERRRQSDIEHRLGSVALKRAFAKIRNEKIK